MYLPSRKNREPDQCRREGVSSNHHVWGKMGFRDLVVEGDALTVIKKLKSDSVDRSVICNIIN
ncbi:hypothetical protein Godav_013883 [Gossypium davidsonii]|uniref:RNase H type-1 domain-containing protein n=3 Tax=Gossypium TaxID=3633 RepID=A0A7J8RIS5_GOSDV|nr:hypothetical protein [Gossypium davidsonii]